MTKLGTIVTAMVTPFTPDGALDAAEAGRIASWLADRGNDGLVVAGSTGEGMTLDAGERSALVRAVKDAVGNRAAVIANVGTNDTRSSIRGAAEAKAAGADALLVVNPYYNKPTQSGMIAHFGAVADSTDLPVVIYNIPSRTSVNFLPASLLELARKHRNVVGVKESSGDLAQIAAIVRDRDAGFAVWIGDDDLFLPGLAVGADGVIGVASHFCSREFRQIYDAFKSGDVSTSASIHASLLALFGALFSITNPIGVKWAMNQLGFRAGSCRLPLDGITPEAIQRIQPLIAPYLSHR